MESTKATLCFVYPDTNVLLHYRLPNEIDWLGLVDAKTVEIVVTRTLIKELEKHKRSHPDKYLRQRADARARFLVDHAKEGERNLRNGVTLRALLRHHGKDLQALHLDPQSADDQLLTEIIAEKEARPTDRHVLVTADGGIALVAQEFDIEIAEPDKRDLLPIEDFSEREVRRLETLVKKYELRMPRLVLRFPNQVAAFEVELAATRPLTEGEIQRQLKLAREVHEPPKPLAVDLPPEEQGDPPVWLRAALESDLFKIPKLKLEEHRLRLRDYFLRLEYFLRNELPKFSARTIRLSFRLHNEGTSPAERIRVSVKSPTFVEVAGIEPPGPQWPRPPDRPKPVILESTYQGPRRNMPDLARMADDLANPHRPVTGPFLRTTLDGTEVAYKATVLDHTYRWELGEVFVTFPDIEAARSFKLPYVLHASNVPEDVTGELHLVVRKLPSPPAVSETRE